MIVLTETEFIVQKGRTYLSMSRSMGVMLPLAMYMILCCVSSEEFQIGEIRWFERLFEIIITTKIEFILREGAHFKKLLFHTLDERQANWTKVCRGNCFSIREI